MFWCYNFSLIPARKFCVSPKPRTTRPCKLYGMTATVSTSVLKASERLAARIGLLMAGAWAATRARGSAPAFVAMGHAPLPSWPSEVGSVGRAATQASARGTEVCLSLTPSAMLACLALWARRRSLWAQRQARSPVARAARGGETLSASHSVVLLEFEAAALRAEVARLQNERSTFQRPCPGNLFDVFDTDSSGGVDAAELQRGLRELTGTEMSAETAKRLLDEYDTDGDGVLQLEELDVERMKATLKQWSREWEAALTSWRHARAERVPDQAPASWSARGSRWASYVGI